MTVTPPPVTPNLPAIRAFVAALRSGQYKQGTRALITLVRTGEMPIDDDEVVVAVEPRYCCLGVACMVAKDAGVQLTVGDRVEGIVPVRDATGERTTAFLPPMVAEYYRFPPPGMISGNYVSRQNPWIVVQSGARVQIHGLPGGASAVLATDANDELGLTFEQIADAFERTYLTAETEE